MKRLFRWVSPIRLTSALGVGASAGLVGSAALGAGGCSNEQEARLVPIPADVSPVLYPEDGDTYDGEVKPRPEPSADAPGSLLDTIGEIDPYNDPALIDPDFERRWAALPLSGTTERIPWTDTYWPKNKGGISHRWRVDQAHTYRSPSKEEVLKMPEGQVADLSPAEKYDLLVANYTYPLTTAVMSANQPKEPSWQGYCHGWAPASIHFREPRPLVMTNQDGLRIRFGSSDIKALLTYFQGEVIRSQWGVLHHPFSKTTRALGGGCSNSLAGNPGCYDSNPGAFHIVMANMIGMRRQGFVIDAVNNYEKWNQPVHTYQTRELLRRKPSARAASSAVSEILVRSAVTYTQEIDPTWEPVLGTPGHHNTEVTYHYTLELDKDGIIVGGQWQLPLSDGDFMSYADVLTYFQQLDEDGDGKPDLSDREASTYIWEYFDFPDFIWVVDAGEFAPEFRDADNRYAFLNFSATTKKRLYAYLSRLGELYARSTE